MLRARSTPWKTVPAHAVNAEACLTHGKSVGAAVWRKVLMVMMGGGVLFLPALCRGQGYVISTVAGGGAYITSIGNGQPAQNAYLNSPDSVAVDAAGNLYIADSGNNMIRRVSAATGLMEAFAGTGTRGLSGDGGPAKSAQLWAPRTVILDAAGNVYISDTSNNRVRKVDANGIITTIAGSANTFTNGALGDGGAALSAALNLPRGLALDATGNLYIADSGNLRVRKVDTKGIITTFAGSGRTGTVGNVGDGGDPTLANIVPAGLALDTAGNLFIADYGNNLIRKVAGGTISSIAGTGTGGYSGDGSTATSALTREAQGVAVDSAGNVFIADTGNAVIRRISSGIISTIAGNGGIGSSGDGGPAGAATLDYPTGVTVTGNGLVYIANSTLGAYRDARIRVLTPVTATLPVISPNGVVGVFSTSTSIAPGSWISIYGSNFASGTQVWNGDFPTVLGNVVVTINSLPAYIWYVSPSQINVQAPDDTTVGTVAVTVTTPGGTATGTVTLNPYSPSLSLFNAKYPVAIVVTPGKAGNSGQGYDYIGPPGAFSFPSRPAVPGETVLLFGVGFGPTIPAVRAGAPFSGVAYSETVPNISIGGVPANVAFAGMVQAGLFQFNVVVPPGLTGDLNLQVSVNGSAIQRTIYLTLQ